MKVSITVEGPKPGAFGASYYYEAQIANHESGQVTTHTWHSDSQWEHEMIGEGNNPANMEATRITNIVRVLLEQQLTMLMFAR